MKISDFLVNKAVTADLKATDKKGIIEELVDLLVSSGAVQKKHKPKLIEVLLIRIDNQLRKKLKKILTKYII